MLWSILLILSISYIVIIALLYFFQVHLVYFPDKRLIYNPETIGLSYEDIHFTTSDGVKLHGWYIAQEHNSTTVLFCHGNAGNISHRLESIQIFVELGLNIFIFDYRGYGQSEGHPNEIGTYRDGQASWDFLIENLKISRENIIIFGRSLGCGIAAWLAQKENPAGLILESSFTSISDLGKKYYPFLPVRWLTRIHYPVAKYVQKIYCPKLFIHSPKDELIPFRQGQNNFRLAAEPKTFLQIQGSHNDGFIVSKEVYVRGLKTFLSHLR